MARDAAGHELVEVDPRALQHDLSRSHARHVEQVVHQARKQPRLPEDHLPPASEAVAPAAHQLHRRQDRAQGIAQLVAEHREKVIAIAHAALELEQQVAHFVLTPPRSKRRENRGKQCDPARGPIQEDDVGEGAEPPPAGDGVVAARPAAARKHEDREVGPGRLSGERRGERIDGFRIEDFLGQKQRPGAFRDPIAQTRHARDGLRRDSGLGKGPARERGVAPRGSEDEDPALERVRRGLRHRDLSEGSRRRLRRAASPRGPRGTPRGRALPEARGNPSGARGWRFRAFRSAS